ncbi:MAG: hypothetical protein AB7U45_03695 [Desulfamplus sp.]
MSSRSLKRLLGLGVAIGVSALMPMAFPALSPMISGLITGGVAGFAGSGFRTKGILPGIITGGLTAGGANSFLGKMSGPTGTITKALNAGGSWLVPSAIALGSSVSESNRRHARKAAALKAEREENIKKGLGEFHNVHDVSPNNLYYNTYMRAREMKNEAKELVEKHFKTSTGVKQQDLMSGKGNYF